MDIDKTNDILRARLSDDNYKKLNNIKSPKVHEFVASYIELCNPAKIFVCTDTEEDLRYVREAAIKNKEESALAIKGHTVHFDGYYDQARDKANTKFLLPAGVNLGPEINAMDMDKGMEEIHGILTNIMQGHELFVRFFCLGPLQSTFTLPCIQLTDSAYVAHSEDLLYRQGYDEFIRLGNIDHFFKFVHSQGRLVEAGLDLLVSDNIKERRLYINLEDEIVFSTNTQYGGNTIGLKKIAMRLAINKASKEGWLTEHMLVMGVRGPQNRVSYLTGAFPSMCGKTSTAMIEGELIVGDDIAYLRIIDGIIRAVNVEKGMFGIIEGINSTDDPLQWDAINRPAEIIFSNVLVTDDKKAYWIGHNGECPASGVNHSGKWTQGKKDKDGNDIPPSHKNARFTFDLAILENADPRRNDPAGIEISGMIYGGRDSDTSVPVHEAFNWTEGIIIDGAGLESETTAATLGKQGVREFNPMSNLDFLSIPIGRYIQNNLDFGAKAKNPPHIFAVNYFLRNSEGKFLNHKNDKKVWLKWMELRVHNDAKAIKTPIGLIPEYTDLKRLFKETFNKEYTEKDYVEQFTIRVPEYLAKIDRLIEIYKTRVTDTPAIVFTTFNEQKIRLEEARKVYGDYIAPEKFR